MNHTLWAAAWGNIHISWQAGAHRRLTSHLSTDGVGPTGVSSTWVLWWLWYHNS